MTPAERIDDIRVFRSSAANLRIKLATTADARRLARAQLVLNGLEGKNEREREAALLVALEDDEAYQQLLEKERQYARDIALVEADIELQLLTLALHGITLPTVAR